MKYLHRTTQRFVTLIEMMIVMFLIAMIIGVVAYNYQGTLEEGKAFKTKTAKDKIETILTLAISENPDLQDNIETRWKGIVKDSPLVQNANDIIKDGWGDEFTVRIENDKVNVTSRKYTEYLQKHPSSMFRENEKK